MVDSHAGRQLCTDRRVHLSVAAQIGVLKPIGIRNIEDDVMVGGNTAYTAGCCERAVPLASSFRSTPLFDLLFTDQIRMAINHRKLSPERSSCKVRVLSTRQRERPVDTPDNRKIPRQKTDTSTKLEDYHDRSDG